MLELLDIVGQDAALAELQRCAGGERRPHAFIFAGPEGVGRRGTAMAFAKLLLCVQPRTVSAAAGGKRPGPSPRKGPRPLPGLPEDFPLQVACGACPSCQTLESGTNPDFQLVYKELARFHEDEKVRGGKVQELSIGVVRQFLIAPAYRSSAGGRGKVFVVLGAEQMSTPAQNALLKTLEEPPAGVTIILIAVAPEELLPTTRSRCRVVRFRPLPVEFVAGKLVEAGLAEGEAKFWATLTGGSLGRALRLSQEDLYGFKKELVKRLAAMGPAGDPELTEMLVKGMDKLSKRFQGRDDLLAASVANRHAGEIVLQILASVYRDALAVACRGALAPASAPHLPDQVHADQTQDVARIAARGNPAMLAEILTQLARFEQLLWRNVNAKLLWDNVAVTCAAAIPLLAD